MEVALTRDVSRSITRCELTYLEREPIDYARAEAQHRAYCGRLEAAGLVVRRLPADEACPDGCFVEDTAVVLDEVAVLAMPGAPSRRAELGPVAAALVEYRMVERLELPATLDGGDVLVVGRRLYVGRSSRTNAAGVDALRAVAEPLGYEVRAVTVSGCLHLKSAVTAVDAETLVVNPAWIDPALLAGHRLLEVDPAEPGAANVLAVGGEVWVHAGYRRTRERLAGRGYRVAAVDVSEFLKAEAGLTCKSLVFRRN